ncbi:hypothetical protein GCM10020000_14600 [Streptomyces olivoverticillatus]
MPGREVGARGERLDRQVRAGVGDDPVLDLAQRGALGGLRGELGAELPLVAGAAQEHHQAPGDGERGLAAEVLLHQGEREVDARGDPGRGGDPAVPHEDGFGVHPQRGIPLGEGLAVRPVGGDAAAVEQAGRGEREGAGAHGDQPPGAGPLFAQPGREPGIGLAGAVAAGHQEDVGRRAVRERRVGHQAQAAAGADRAAVDGRGAHPVGVRAPELGGFGEHLEGGPVTSRLWTPSKRTISTVRLGVMTTMLGGRPPHDCNDENPTYPAMISVTPPGPSGSTNQ